VASITDTRDKRHKLFCSLCGSNIQKGHLGEGGYQVGNFPVGWTEWNGQYCDVVRDYRKGEGGLIGELAYRLTGSSDLYERGGRKPCASINFITAHDGFTLHDLVSYNEKHNEANPEDNRDGEDHNRSWNCDVEGPTDDPDVLALRARQKRNFLASLLLSQSVPMLLAGDEMGRSQQGNNNAYCQDNEISWWDWELGEEDRELMRFVQRVLQLRKAHPTFRRRSFFEGRRIRKKDIKDIVWLNPDGEEMDDEQWQHAFARCLGMYLSGSAIDERDACGHRITDDDFLLLLNAYHEAVPFRLPDFDGSPSWQVLIDTTRTTMPAASRGYRSGDIYSLQSRSFVLLTHVVPEATQ
jgi:glycogen operon protein